MRLDHIKIRNYRNLDGIEIKLNPETNFLVGENDLGKSNFLDLLYKIFNSKFEEEDFFNKKEDIDIMFSLLLDDGEIGIFDDLCDPTNYNKININAKMGFSDDYIRYSHFETGETIHKDEIRCVNFIKYTSLRKPSDELDFYKKRGVGKLLHFMVEKMLEDNSNHSLINEDFVRDIIAKVNDNLSKIRIFEEFGIETSIESDPIDLMCRILSIKDSKDMHISKIGHGVQFSVVIVLSILEKLMYIMETRLSKKCIFNKDGNRSISLILGLDEPEIHLHPYRQRNLINYIINLINNKEKGFSSLIKEVFEIDEINGQSIVVTHSPNIITDNYKQITRFYKKNGITCVKSGTNIKLDDNLEKQLLKNIPYVKEAFFSRCNILVEGDSEVGALPIFAKEAGLDLDELGISVIQAGGAGSIPNLAILLNLFEIKNVGILDEKEFKGFSTKINKNKLNLNSTAYKDFEEDIFKSFDIIDYIKFKENKYPKSKLAFKTAAENLGKTIDITKPIYDQIEPVSKLEKYLLKKSITSNELKFLGAKKSIIMGIDLANSVSKIPNSYMNLLKKARRLADE